MASTLDLTADVYEGIWTDWSRGKTWGLTWTLCPTQATILTNTLALFVTISGIRLWTIIRYILYQVSTSAQPDMTPHMRDRQVILRNEGSALSTAWLMMNLARSSRRQTSGRRSWSSYGIGLFAITYTVMFWIAGVFSNKAISASSANGSSAVLTRSKHCGLLNDTYSEIVENTDFIDESEYDLFVENKAKKEHDTQLSLEYVQTCYLPQPSKSYKSFMCNTMKTASLDWTVTSGVCPFAPQMCHKTSKVIVLDTGEIDSHNHLGINAPPQDRLSYQRLTTCAVLEDSKYITGWDGKIVNNYSSLKPEPQTAFANFGPSLYKNTNYTYAYSNFVSFYDPFTAQVTLPYQLEPELAYAPANPQWSYGDFDPINEVAQDKADLVLLFLGFGGMYFAPIDDPWFSSHQIQVHPTLPPFLQSWFYRDRAISTLGCTVQHQFCTENKTCTGYGGFDQVQNNVLFNNALTSHQNATFNRLLEAVAYSELKTVVENFQRTITPLLASNVTMEGNSGAVLSPKLPVDQWTIEVNFWHSVAMAQFQRNVVQWATGQQVAKAQYLLPPSEEQDKWFCKNMIVPSIVYQSFSLVAIILIVVFGSLFVSISLTIDDLAAFIRKKLKRSPPRRSWDHFHMLSNRTPMRTRFRPEDLWQRTITRRNTDTDEGVELERSTTAPSIHRISSPTLPPEDRSLSISASQPNFSRPRPLNHLAPPQRPARDSWLAISLSNFDIEAGDPPGRATERLNPRRVALTIIPPALITRSSAQTTRRDSAGHYQAWM